MEEVPDFGAVFTFGKSKFGDNNANKFWVKNDPVRAAACGDEHTAVVTSTGRVYTFGSNQWGQLALGHTNQTNKPSFVKSLKGTMLTHVACGRSHTLLASQDNVYACGGNGEHQVNESEEDEITRPYLIPSLSGIKVKHLSCGVEHSMLLSVEGDLYLWGTGSEGQLGMGPNVTELLKPTILQFADEKIRDASCGYYHTGIVTQSGKVFTFGESESGKLGLGEECEDSYSVPQPVFLVDCAVGIACGNSCTAVRATNGQLYMTGDGQRGQLGFSPKSINKCVYTLSKVPCPPITYVAVGEGHTAVVSKSGYLYTFGDGRHGKLCHGDDNFANLFSPYLVESFSTIATVESVACGGCHTMVIAKPGRPVDTHQPSGKRLNKLSRLRQDTNVITGPQNNSTIPDIKIESEHVKSLESALGEKDEPKKIVQLDKTNNKLAEKKDNASVDKKKPHPPKIEEDSGSETDEPGATSDVTDSEEEEVSRFTENLMSIEELTPAPVTSTPNVIRVKSSISENEIEKETHKSPEEPQKSLATEVDKSVLPAKQPVKQPNKHANKQPAIKEEEEESETDEEGDYTDETEDETEEEETEEKKKDVKTLVSEVPATDGTKTTSHEVKSEEETDTKTETVKPKESKSSKFKFWKKKPKKVEVPPPEQPPGNQHNSKACIIL